MEEGKPKDNFVDGGQLITTLSINKICKSLELSISDLQRMRFVPEYLHPTPTSHSLSPCVCRRVSESRSATHPRVLILLHVLIRFLSFPFLSKNASLSSHQRKKTRRKGSLLRFWSCSGKPAVRACTPTHQFFYMHICIQLFSSPQYERSLEVGVVRY